MIREPRFTPRQRRAITQMTDEMNAMCVNVPETDEHRERKRAAEKKMARHDARLELKLRMRNEGGV